MSRPHRSKRRSPVLFLAALTVTCVAACAAPADSSAAQTLRRANPLIDVLRQVEGHYAWDRSRDAYTFSEKPALATLAEEAEPERHLPVLVDCLDADTPTKVSLAGNPVPLGQLCYEVLTMTAYHEAVDAQGDIVANWPGHLEPQAGPTERAAAKTAWQGVLQAGSYILY